MARANTSQSTPRERGKSSVFEPRPGYHRAPLAVFVAIGADVNRKRCAVDPTAEAVLAARDANRLGFGFPFHARLPLISAMMSYCVSALR
jgi:hypothetical protein